MAPVFQELMPLQWFPTEMITHQNDRLAKCWFSIPPTKTIACDCSVKLQIIRANFKKDEIMFCFDQNDHTKMIASVWKKRPPK